MTWDIQAIPDIFTPLFVLHLNQNNKNVGLELNAVILNTIFLFLGIELLLKNKMKEFRNLSEIIGCLNIKKFQLDVNVLLNNQNKYKKIIIKFIGIKII